MFVCCVCECVCVQGSVELCVVCMFPIISLSSPHISLPLPLSLSEDISSGIVIGLTSSLSPTLPGDASGDSSDEAAPVVDNPGVKRRRNV